MSSSTDEDIDEEFSEQEIEEEEEEETKSRAGSESSRSKGVRTVHKSQPLAFGIQRLHRISKWMDNMRGNLTSIHGLQNEDVGTRTEANVSRTSSSSRKTASGDIPSLLDDGRFQAVLSRLLVGSTVEGASSSSSTEAIDTK